MIERGSIVRPLDERRLWRVLGDTRFGVCVERDRTVRVLPRDRVALLTPQERGAWAVQPWDHPQDLAGRMLISLVDDDTLWDPPLTLWDPDLLPPPGWHSAVRGVLQSERRASRNVPFSVRSLRGLPGR